MGGLGGGGLGRGIVEGRKERERRAEEAALTRETERLRTSSDAQDAGARRRARAAAIAAPGSATSILTEEADPLGIKRRKLLGI